MSTARLVTSAVVALCALLVPAAPVWGDVPPRFAYDSTFVDPDTCGDGYATTVHVTNHFIYNSHIRQGLYYGSTTLFERVTVTYEPTGKMVVIDWVGAIRDSSIVDNGDGTVTIR